METTKLVLWHSKWLSTFESFLRWWTQQKLHRKIFGACTPKHFCAQLADMTFVSLCCNRCLWPTLLTRSTRRPEGCCWQDSYDHTLNAVGQFTELLTPGFFIGLDLTHPLPLTRVSPEAWWEALRRIEKTVAKEIGNPFCLRYRLEE